MKLIDKDKVVEAIKKIYNEDYKFLPSDLVEGVQDFKDDLLRTLDTLEVKEVDLEKEIRTAYKSNRRYSGKYNMLVVINELQFTDITKHFFELGLKAQKGE